MSLTPGYDSRDVADQAASLSSSHNDVGTDEYHLHRMLLGLPEGPSEITPGSALPLESSMDIHGGGEFIMLPTPSSTDSIVDFRKGCYLGQELTVRTYHTGATRKRILPIRLFPLDTPSAQLSTLISPEPSSTGPPGLDAGKGVDIMFHPGPGSATRRSKSAGRILSTHPTSSSVGLGLVRLEFAERTWWSSPLQQRATIPDWAEGSNGRLSASIGGTEWGVYVGQGEAYGAALRDQEARADKA